MTINVGGIRLSNTLIEKPCCWVASNGIRRHLERFSQPVFMNLNHRNVPSCLINADLGSVQQNPLARSSRMYAAKCHMVNSIVYMVANRWDMFANRLILS